MSSRGDARRQAGLKTRLYVVAALACVGAHADDAERHADVLPGRPAPGGQRPRARRRQGEADRGQQRLRLRRAHVLQARRSPADPRGQRQHDGRSPGLDLVHQPHRPSRDVDRRDRARTQPAETPNIDGWPIVEGKSSGITPGYRVVDPDGRLYQVKFDPPSNPGDGQRRRGDRRGLLSRARLQRRPGLRRRRGPGEDRHRAQRDDGGHARAAEADDAATTSTGCSRAARSCRTASTARRSAASPTAGRSATSSTTARVPTIRTTSTRTSIAASCAPIACSPPG